MVSELHETSPRTSKQVKIMDLNLVNMIIEKYRFKIEHQ